MFVIWQRQTTVYQNNGITGRIGLLFYQAYGSREIADFSLSLAIPAECGTSPTATVTLNSASIGIKLSLISIQRLTSRVKAKLVILVWQLGLLRWFTVIWRHFHYTPPAVLILSSLYWPGRICEKKLHRPTVAYSIEQCTVFHHYPCGEVTGYL